MAHEAEGGTRRISDVRRAAPADATLGNLLEVLKSQLETCARLTVFEYEAQADGHANCARTFADLAARERESFETTLASLRSHLSGMERVR